MLQNKAVVLTDGRYIIQVKQQVDSAFYETGNIVKRSLADWLAENAGQAKIIGYDPRLHTQNGIEALEKKKITLKPVPNLVDEIWADQPGWPREKADAFPGAIAGLSSVEKRDSITAGMKKDNIDAVVITLPDSIAWLLNVRGHDVDYVPLVLSYLILYADGHADWFVDAVNKLYKN